MDIDLNQIKVETDWPLIARMNDDIYPYNDGFDHLRYTARAFCENEKGLFGFLHIVGEDYFGKRDHLETIGGGIEENEDFQTALIREVKEEAGLEARDIKIVGSILDSYNLIRRITFSTFFHCLVDTREKEEMHRTSEEEILISEIVWLDPLEALYRLENIAEHDVDKLVQRRDAAALRYYLENFTDLIK